MHLVDWASVCKPNANGGLGFRPIKNMNKALLGKGLWRLGNSSAGLWRRIITAKYGASRNGCNLNEPNYRHSALLKDILLVMELFMESIYFKVG